MALFGNSRARIYLAAWMLALSTFAVRAIPDFVGNIVRGKVPRAEPNASMDAFLVPILQLSQPSRRLFSLFALLPANASILFVSTKGDDRWDFVYSAVCYLSWPRKIERVELQPNERFARPVRNDTAVIFCGLPAAIDSPNRVALGSNLVLLKPVAAP
jgi:hypothetical protein